MQAAATRYPNAAVILALATTASVLYLVYLQRTGDFVLLLPSYKHHLLSTHESGQYKREIA